MGGMRHLPAQLSQTADAFGKALPLAAARRAQQAGYTPCMEAPNSACQRATFFPANRKSVTWKLGADNDVWVWVMGEHPSDKSYAAICEEIQARRAKRLLREQSKEGR